MPKFSHFPSALALLGRINMALGTIRARRGIRIRRPTVAKKRRIFIAPSARIDSLCSHGPSAMCNNAAVLEPSKLPLSVIIRKIAGASLAMGRALLLCRSRAFLKLSGAQRRQIGTRTGSLNPGRERSGRRLTPGSRTMSR